MSKFGDAFKAARAAGKSEFTFGGKKYNTKMKGEDEAPKPRSKPSMSEAPKPRARPMASPSAASALPRSKPKIARKPSGPAGVNPQSTSASDTQMRSGQDSMKRSQDRAKKAADSNTAKSRVDKAFAQFDDNKPTRRKWKTAGAFKRGGMVGKKGC